MVLNLKKIILSTLLSFLVTLNVFAYIPTFETTRTKSFSGGGVASLLLNESTFLNPAAIAFFQKSTMYLQKGSHSLNDPSKTRIKSFPRNDDQAILITDTSSGLKGGVSYLKQDFNRQTRSRYSASLASTLGKKSAFGLIYRYTDEDSTTVEKQYHQIVAGFTHIFNEKLMFGGTVEDPNQEVSEYFKYTIGAQYTLTGTILIIADIGSTDVQNYEENSFYKVGAQLQSFKRLYLRYSIFNLKKEKTSGAAWGASWVGPRFSIDYAYKESLGSEESFFLLEDERLIEHSFSLTALF